MVPGEEFYVKNHELIDGQFEENRRLIGWGTLPYVFDMKRLVFKGKWLLGVYPTFDAMLEKMPENLLQGMDKLLDAFDAQTKFSVENEYQRLLLLVLNAVIYHALERGPFYYMDKEEE